MSRTLIWSCASAAALLLCASPAFSQTPTNSASYSGDIMITAQGQAMAGKMYRTPSKMRMEMNVNGQDAVSIFDFQSGMASSIVDVGMGQPMVMNIDTKQYGAASMEANFERLSPTGASKVVSGMSCKVYHEPEQGADICMTLDGVMLEAIAPDSTMRMSNVVRGAQSPSLFVVPAGGMDINAMMGDAMRQAQQPASGEYQPVGQPVGEPAQGETFPEELAREMQEEAERESKRKAKKKAKKLIKGLF